MSLITGLDRFRLDGSGGGAQISISTSRFLTGTAANAILAAIIAPIGWTVSVISGSDFGGRVKVDGRQLQAATALSAPATGTTKLRAVSADGRDAIEKTFDLSVVSGGPLTLSRAADGSLGQVYTPSSAGQWVTRTNAGVVADIAGQTGATYTAQVADTGKTIGVRNGDGTVTWASGPVMGAPLLLDGMDTTAGHGAVGTGTVVALRTDRKVQGTGALQVDGLTTTATAGADFTTSETIDPATLGVIAFSVDRLTEGVITGQQLFVHAGTPNGSVAFSNDQLLRPGQRFLAMNVSEIPAVASAAAAPIRVRPCINKGTSLAAMAIFDAVIARAGGRPTVLLSFDDGYKTIRSAAYPELNARGLKATVYPAPNLLNQGSGDFEFMTTADVQFLHAQGWDIGCDGTMNDAAVSTDPATAVAAAQQVRSWVEANVGMRASRFLCWPFGNDQSDDVSEAMVSAGFLACRGTQNQPGYSHTRFGIPRTLQKKYPSQGIGSSTVPATIAALIDTAISRGVTLSLHMHSFTESTGNTIFIPSSVYTLILDYVAQKRNEGSIDVLTVSEWWARDSMSSVPV